MLKKKTIREQIVRAEKTAADFSAAVDEELPGKMVRGLAVIVLPGPGEGLGPFGMVEGIGIELGFQGNAAALAVIHAALAGFLQEVTCLG